MSAFMILALVSVAYARPDVSLGYNYEQAGSHHAYTPGLAAPLETGHFGSSSNNIPTINVGGSTGFIPQQTAHTSVPSQHLVHAIPTQHVAAPIQHFQQASTPQFVHAAPTQHIAAPIQHVAAPIQHFQQSSTPQFVQAAPIQVATAPQFAPVALTSQGPSIVEEAPVHQAPIITKQFYLHSAPEDHDSIGKTKHFVLGRAQKNYRVVFIKSPSSSNANVRLSAEYAPQEEKTVIYVLSQKEHELDVNDIATPAPTQPSKPEVFFIKYNTPEEAAHAQQEIQGQYNVLGGESLVSDEGAAPVTSVIGSLGQGELPAASSNHAGAAYLPPQH